MLSSENLVLLLLKSTFGLFQSSLKLLLLNFKAAALFVQLVDGSATISQLVKKILDLIGEILIFPPHNIKLLISLIPGSLNSESLRVVVAAFSVAGFKLSFKSVPGLLGGSNLGVQSINGLFCLCNTAGELVLAGLKLIDTSKTFNFKLRTPKLNLSLSLRQSTENIILLLRFFLNFFTKVLSLSVEVLKLGQKRSTVTGLSIGQALGILQLSGQRNLILSKSSNSILSFLNLSVQVLCFNLELLLGRVGFIEGTGHFIKLWLDSTMRPFVILQFFSIL